jgi:hypothetical protein
MKYLAMIGAAARDRMAAYYAVTEATTRKCVAARNCMTARDRVTCSHRMTACDRSTALYSVSCST